MLFRKRFEKEVEREVDRRMEEFYWKQYTDRQLEDVRERCNRIEDRLYKLECKVDDLVAAPRTPPNTTGGFVYTNESGAD